MFVVVAQREHVIGPASCRLESRVRQVCGLIEP